MATFKRQNYTPKKFKGDYTFSDFSYGLYNLETPRSLPEQATSLALIGGQNVFTEKGALISQYGYDVIGDIEGRVYKIVADNTKTNDIIIFTYEGYVYRYNTLERIKRYKTTLSTNYFNSNTALTHSGKDVYIYAPNNSPAFSMFGGRYNDADNEENFVAISENKTFNAYQGYIQIAIDEDDEYPYYWLDKEVVIKDGTSFINATVSSVSTNSINLIVDSTIQSSSIDIGEICIRECEDDTSVTAPEYPEFYWEPSADAITPDIPAKFLSPKLMAVVLNRIWIVDVDNTIYYSAVGSLTDFRQDSGAGYFKGFYHDTSNILSIEEYYSGALIVKETGMYHASFKTVADDLMNIGSTGIEDYISVKKINNIIQKFPGDHVIIGSEVVAFDSSSGNLVLAAYVNYLGNIQEGSILLYSGELDSQVTGLLSSNKRLLTYSFQEEVLIIYYGKFLNEGLVINRNLSMFPRLNNKIISDVQMFYQGLIAITSTGEILDDFKKGTIIPDIPPTAAFEPIAIRGNKLLCGSIIEVTELNGIRYEISTLNAGSSYQKITPVNSIVNINSQLPNLVYSDSATNFIPASFAESTKWAGKKSQVTRMYAPLSGRDGLQITIEFEPNCALCLLALRFPEMSQGE
ncbi:MAG: hypothetical protein J6Y02_13250 [Pseudobutyrivibrio sp.]|nr:hypothetical protein [Pseudobutyrivibrio sp.]